LTARGNRYFSCRKSFIKTSKTPFVNNNSKNFELFTSVVLLSRLTLQTLERSYLLKINGKVVERPQHMLMRVSIGIHGDDVDAAIEVAC